jgi:hypothetical protein
MKRFLLLVFFAVTVNCLQAQLEEDFSTDPTDWILSQGANWRSGDGVVLTPGVGGNNPANIGTPIVNKTSNTVKVCFDIWAVDAGNGNTKLSFPCQTYADVLFVKSTVGDSKDAEKAANIYARIDNYELPLNGGTTCFTFTFPAAVTASTFKVFISFHAPCNQGGVKYTIDNVLISGVDEVCSGNTCPPTALNDQFTRGDKTEMSFNAVLYGSNSSYPAVPAGGAVDLTGTDNDQNDGYDHLKWTVLTQPVNGTAIINADKTITITRLSNAVTTLTFTYSLCDDGTDNTFGTSDDLCDEATVTVNWPVAAALPVSLINFNATRGGSYVTLQWTTTLESNNAGFEIQRSTGNGIYTTAGFVATKAADGNSSTPLHYQYKELNTSGSNTWYRLVQTDKDGTRTFSTVKGVRGMEESAKVTVYPNPGTSGNMNVLFGSSATRDIIIADLSGKVVKHWSNFRDDNMVINGLNPGVYMLMITNKATSERQAHKLVIIK